MKKQLYIFGGLILATALFFIFGQMNNSAYREAAEMGGDYLVRMQQEDGSFLYNYDPIADQDLGGLNILRHAGTTYSLLELYRETNDGGYLETAERALEYLLNHIEGCGGELLCVVEGGQVKLGGNALAILAFVEYEKATGDGRYTKSAQGLARWVLSTQTEKGEFSPHIVNVYAGNIPDDHVSEYYPGEAIFALVRLYEIDGDEKWLAAARSASEWLITVRDAALDIHSLNHDHWLLYGLNALDRHDPDQLWRAHTEKIVRAILDAQHKNLPEGQRVWNGGYYNPPRSTPTATRTEGLSAAYQLLDRYDERVLQTEVAEAIEGGIAFQLRTQMDEGRARVIGASPQSLGGFTASLTDYTIRIDYVQHNISALLGGAKVL